MKRNDPLGEQINQDGKAFNSSRGAVIVAIISVSSLALSGLIEAVKAIF